MGYIKDIDPILPTDVEQAGDGAKHLRKLKDDLVLSFPNMDKGVNLTSEQLNLLNEAISFSGNSSEKIIINAPNIVPDPGVVKNLLIESTGELIKGNNLGSLGAIKALPFTQEQADDLYGVGNYILCNGQGLPVNSRLAIVLGFTDIGNQFLLPDMRGVVPRGHDPRIYADDYLTNDDSGKNPGNPALGEFQDDTFQDHTHMIRRAQNWVKFYIPDSGYYYRVQSGSGANPDYESFNHNSKKDVETRVKARILNFFMRVN